MPEMKSVDELLYKACRENRESLISYGPDFNEIEREALVLFRKRQKSRKRKAWVRAAAAVAAVFILVNGSILLTTEPTVMAYRNSVKALFYNLVNGDSSSSTEMQILYSGKKIKEAQKSVPYAIPYPHWLPEGYTLKSVKVKFDGRSIYKIGIMYSNQNDMLYIDMENDSPLVGTQPSDGEPAYEKVEISGKTAFISFFTVDDRAIAKCNYLDGNILVSISGYMNREELKQFITEMKP